MWKAGLWLVISSSVCGYVSRESRPFWFKMADYCTWSTFWVEVKRELKERISGWAIVTNPEACGALPNMKDLCIAIQYTPGVCCFLWVFVLMQHSFITKGRWRPQVGLGWRWCKHFFGSHSYILFSFFVTLSTKDFPYYSVFRLFAAIFFFFVSLIETFSEVTYHCSHHISFWCWAEYFFKNRHHIFSRNLQDQPGVGRNFFWCKIHFFPPYCCCGALFKSQQCLHLKWR